MKRKVTYETPARRQVIQEVSPEAMVFLDQLRWNEDRAGFVAIYERESVIAARVEFLDAVRRVAPEVFAELLAIRADQSGESDGPRLDDWQRRWNLTAEWCGFAAFHTTNDPGDEPPPSFIYPEFEASRPFKPPPAPELPAFDPTREIWASYEKRCGTLLAEYRRRSYPAAEQQKFKPVEDRRSLHQHLSWLAAYQCLRAPISAIAEAAGRQRAAIDYGVKTAAKFIGLKRRPAKSSSPRGDDRKRLVDRLVVALAE